MYASFLLEHDASFVAEFPVKYYCSGTYVSSPQTLNHLLGCLQYWGVSEVPEEAVHYVLTHPKDSFDVLVTYADVFQDISSVLRTLGIDREERLLVAIESGSTSIVTWLLRNGYVPTALHVSRAKATSDPNLHCLISLSADEDASYAAAYAAAAAGDVATLKQSLVDGRRPPAELSELAAAAGSVKCLDFLFGKKCAMSATVAINAAKCGSLPCLQFLHHTGALWHYSVCYHAACGGHLECVRFAFGLLGLQGAMRWDRDMEYVRGAVEHRRAECLAYLLSRGCRGDASVCATAAHNGDLACLRVLHEHGCAWDARTIQAAAQGEHWECLMFALEHGCPEE